MDISRVGNMVVVEAVVGEDSTWDKVVSIRGDKVLPLVRRNRGNPIHIHYIPGV